MADSIKPTPGAQRLDAWLVRRGLADSRRQARDLIAAGHVRVNGRRWRKGRSVGFDDVVELDPPSAAPALTPDSHLPLDVLYHDEEILVVNKPALLPCHPLHLEDRPTLMNLVAAHFPQAAHAGNKPLEGGLVHRLDNGTSGAIMVALSEAGFVRLRAALKSGQIERSYVALIAGALEHPLELDTPIAHHPRNRRKMTVVHDPRAAAKLKARPAMTAVTPIRKVNGFTLVEVIPRTGSRHQIRVHLADAGWPIAGDDLYGGPAMAALAPGRFFLHLAELRIPPAGKRNSVQISSVDDGQETLIVVAPLPDDLQACVEDPRP
ncbi:MAG TPA: RluA family pseudouridine synthase [Candidatus Binataceae bacterium]|nr:RluA family pseudouridine synthase [Candidatus Binataceae bacterium]